MYAIHPATIHFPLGLLLASGLFTVIYLRRGEPTWEVSAYHCLMVGWLTGVLALISGIIDALRQLNAPDMTYDNTLIGWINIHAFLHVAVIIMYGQALLLRRRNPGILGDSAARRGYLIRHALGAILLIAGGWVGGHLVYTFGLGK
ncbi:MAG: DUF2231 domain-containing protein [Oscillochloris sp.]|nr:DUF2231 domain-containing protein [Oscillochloris sp.]